MRYKYHKKHLAIVMSLCVSLFFSGLQLDLMAQPSQGVFDTELAAVSESSGLFNALSGENLFNRKVGRFEVGWNFSSLSSKIGNEELRISVFDDNFFAGTDLEDSWHPVANDTKLNRMHCTGTTVSWSLERCAHGYRAHEVVFGEPAGNR